MKINAAQKHRVMLILLTVMALIIAMNGNVRSKAYAQDTPTGATTPEPAEMDAPIIEVINPYFSIEHRTLGDGSEIAGYIINGPPFPLPEYEAERAASIMPTVGAAVIPDFPSFAWVFGCSAVSGAMIATYYDRGAYPNMYAGPTDGGVMPLTDTSWPTWNDGFETYPNNPLIASHQGVDGRTERGSIDDYWVKYESTANDPYITNGWTQHTWGTAIGDYMKTSQSAAPYNNVDGSTTFYNYISNSGKLTCSTMETEGIAAEDGTYGRKLFYEARGYTVTDCYNQKTDNNAGGFTLANFQAEIDAGNPVFLNLYGHSVVGYGYNGSTIYIRDTWDNNPGNSYTMPWGGSYDGMNLLSVSIVHLAGGTTAPEMDVRGNNVSIADGDTTPSLADHTDSGTTPVVGGTVSRVYTIFNSGNAALNLSGSPKVSVSGTHAADFSVTVQPSSPVAPAGSSTFTVVFNPSAAGLRSATLSIVNNDTNENPYNFAIQGNGSTVPMAKRTYLPLVLKMSPNQKPTNILLSKSSILENQPVNTVVGALSTVDPNVGDAFTYSLVSGTGSTDNKSFNISGNKLRSSAVFDFETKNSYSIRVRSTDRRGLYFEKAFTITVTQQGVQILSNTSHYVDSINYLHIVGEVQNNTADNLRFVSLTANFFDASNQLLGSDYTYTKLENLPAWDKTCFEILTPLPAGFSSYEFEAPSFWTDGEPLPNLAILNDSGTYDADYGWYTITGQVRNDHGARVEYVEPVGTLYDASGIVIGCWFSFVETTHLDPSQTSTFEMTFWGRDFSDMDSYRLQVDGNPLD